MQRLLLALIRRYQAAGGENQLWVNCNFNPTCSTYALRVLEKHGALRGSILAIKRIMRCRDRQRMIPMDDFPP